jgi:uncharacterized membrane protein YkoI
VNWLSAFTAHSQVAIRIFKDSRDVLRRCNLKGRDIDEDPGKTWAGAAAVAACALVGATVAFGAGNAKKASGVTTTTTSSITATGGSRTPETALTGDTLAKVKAAAIAKVGGAVDSATTENDSSDAAATYEAYVTKAGGSHVTVILDSSFNVLTTETGGPGGGHGGQGGGNGETELTGDVATKAKAAAVAKAGGTADRATTETDSANTAATYEVHVTKTDGSRVVVILDKDYAVLSVETQPADGFGVHGGHRH